MSQELLKQLRATRGDYAEECCWHKFLIDAAYGTGGFRGRYAATDVSVLGWAATAYARFNLSLSGQLNSAVQFETYLDQFAREDYEKFRQRVRVAHYRNYVGPIAQILVSYVNEKEMVRSSESDATIEWREDCDGNGTSWDMMLNDVIRPRAANPGWCPVLLDMPDTFAGQDEVTLADVQEAGGTSPRAIPLYPLNILDFRTDQSGRIIAAKIRTDHDVGDDLLGPSVCEEHYALWYEDRVERYIVRDGDKVGREKVEGPVVVKHSWGMVPLFIFRGEPTPGDGVRGRSIVADMAIEARTHFNISSEKRDHERGQVFAILGIPVETMETDVGEVIAGNGSALKVPMNANMPLHYVAPPSSVADTLDKSLVSSVQEMYRISRIEYDEPTQNTSGIARAYRFRQTNSRLRNLAGGWARAEQELLRAVDKALGTSEPEVTITEAGDYSIEDVATDIANALSVITMPIGPTAKAEIMKRTVRAMTPNLPRDVQADIEEEIDASALQDAQNAELADEQQRAVDAERLASAGTGGETGAEGMSRMDSKMPNMANDPRGGAPVP